MLKLRGPRPHRRTSGRRRRKPGEDNPLVMCACGCRQRFKLFDKAGRPRQFVKGHKAKFPKRYKQAKGAG